MSIYRSLLVLERYCEPAALSQRLHALLQLYTVVPVCGEQHRGDPRTDHSRAAGAPNCEPTPSVGITRYLYRTDKESDLQLLES